MKAAVTLFFLIAYFQAQACMVSARAIEDTTALEPQEEECVNELNLNKKEITRLNNQDIAPDNNAAFNSFLGCYYKKMEWQDSNGNINYDNFKESLEGVITGELENESPAVKMLVKQMMFSTVTECQNNPPPAGNSHGQTAVRVQNCIMQKLNDMLSDA